MKIKKLSEVLVIAATVAILPVNNANAADLNACYKSESSIDVLRLNVKTHSVLSNAFLSGEPIETVYSVHGRNIAWFDEWTAFAADGTGTVDVAAWPSWNATPPSDEPTGSHMGFETVWVDGDGIYNGNRAAFNVSYDCKSNEVNPTPSAWYCQVANDSGLYIGSQTLTKVDPSSNEACNEFVADSFGPNKPLLSTGAKIATIKAAGKNSNTFGK